MEYQMTAREAMSKNELGTFLAHGKVETEGGAKIRRETYGREREKRKKR
jgi:hypothetical protein